MMKIASSILVIAAIAACNKTDTSSAAVDAGTATSTSAQPTTVTNVVDKALSFLGGGGPFEGEITMNTSDPPRPPRTITYDVKGLKLRFDAPAEGGPMAGGYVIFDTQTKTMTAVNDAKKTAMVMTAGGMNPAAPPAEPKPTVEKTGKMDTVAGYSCEIWKMSDAAGGEKSEVCVAKGIAFPVMGHQRHSAGWMSSLEDAFPLRAVTYDASGKEKSRMEVTKIDRKPIDDAKFQVPAGYQTTSMDEMMKNLGGLRGMGNFRPPR